MTKTKLTKAQEKRFDDLKYRNAVTGESNHEILKQHLVDELARQKKELVEKFKECDTQVGWSSDMLDELIGTYEN